MQCRHEVARHIAALQVENQIFLVLLVQRYLMLEIPWIEHPDDVSAPNLRQFQNHSTPCRKPSKAPGQDHFQENLHDRPLVK